MLELNLRNVFSLSNPGGCNKLGMAGVLGAFDIGETLHRNDCWGPWGQAGALRKAGCYGAAVMGA